MVRRVLTVDPLSGAYPMIDDFDSESYCKSNGQQQEQSGPPTVISVETTALLSENLVQPDQSFLRMLTALSL